MGKRHGSKYAKKKEEQRHGLRPHFGGTASVNGSGASDRASKTEAFEDKRTQKPHSPAEFNMYMRDHVDCLVTLSYFGGENIPLQEHRFLEDPVVLIPAEKDPTTRISYLEARKEGELWTVRRFSGFARQETAKVTFEGSHIRVAQLLGKWSAIAGAHPQNAPSQQEHMKDLDESAAYVTRNTFRSGRYFRPSERGLQL